MRLHQLKHASSAPPRQPHPSYQRLSRYDETGLCWLLHRQRVLDLVDRALRWRLASQVDAFASSLQRRLGRDEARLYDYHDRLFQDAWRRVAALPRICAPAPPLGAG